MERRDVLRMLAASAGAGAARGLIPSDLLALGRAVHARVTTTARASIFSSHASETVVAAAERIIPASDTPGATEARVNLFVDRMLADWYEPADRDRFLAGLRELDAQSRARHGRDFIACAHPEQDALLMAFDEEVAALRRASPGDLVRQRLGNPDEHWFAMLKYLTVLGYCTSEVAQRRTLHQYPLPGRYEACAPYEAASPGRAPS